MPVQVRVDNSAKILAQLEYLQTHVARVGVLTGPTKGNESAGDALHVEPPARELDSRKRKARRSRRG